MRFCSVFAALAAAAALQAAPSIFPIPREASFERPHFAVNEEVVLALPVGAGEADRKLARLIMADLSDRFGVALRPREMARLPRGGRVIVAGTLSSPLVKEAVALRKLRVSAREPGPEGYVLDVSGDLAVVAGCDDAGAFYGVQSLRQLFAREGGAVRIAGAAVRDWPFKPFRGIKLYLPGRDNIPYFKRFVRDFMALYKYNRLVLELNAAMRLDRHPELNAGWLDFARHLNASRRDRPAGPHGESTDSAHHDTADGGILEKEELRELSRYAAEHRIEVVPELPSLTHSYYLLTRHRELAEIPDTEWPDTYCPSLAASYQLLFEVMDEYLEVLRPRMAHIGKDEWRMPWGVCPRCRHRDYRELFVEDLRKTHGYLKARGVEVAMWGDHLIEPLRGAGLKPRTAPGGYQYQAPGAITPRQAASLPKDILMFNWFWDERHAATGQGEAADRALEAWGFRQVYGNMTPEVQDFDRRAARPGVLGGAPSSWAATTEFNFGKDLLGSFLGCANLLWGSARPSAAEMARLVQERVEWSRPMLGGAPSPSELDPVEPLPFRPAPAAGAVAADELRLGTVRAGRFVFHAAGPAAVGTDGARPAEWPREGPVVAVGADASSLVFLHAAARPANSFQGYRYIYNFEDSADLLGWYEVVYQDGFVATVPIRYRADLLEWSRLRRPESRGHCFRGSAVDLSADPARPVVFYAYEWTNPRLGKPIREVRLKGTAGFEQGGRVIAPNGVLLAAVSIVRKRPASAARATSEGKAPSR